MVLRKVLTYFNIAILVAVVLGLGVVYWYAGRPLPETSGTLRAPLSGRATVDRDALGVPHITAASVEDALFLQGLVAAQDRLWQMDTLRRLAVGRLAEVFGPRMLELDREARRLRMERQAERDATVLPAGDRAVLAAYARGVNHFIDTHRDRLPLEFSLLRYDPRPWRIADSLAISLFMYRSLTTTWRLELQKQHLLEGGDPAKVNFLFPARAGNEVQPGSNAWAMSGARSATGRALLANDPHLEWSIPGIWHMVHLRAPGLNVSGVALPGVPCIILGHNDRIAWGATNLQFDVQDLYREVLDPRTGRYVFRGQLEQARLEREAIPVKGGPPVETAQWVTRHGPVFSDEGHFYSLRWAAAEVSLQFPFLDLDRARNWQEFLAALQRYPGPGQNFVYADVDGNIGYHATGQLPVRRNWDGDLPVDGSSGNYEWDGFIPFEQLPQTYNPVSGLIVTANQNPFPENYPYPVNGDFAAPYRSGRIYQILSARNGWRAAEMLGVQTDLYSPLCHFLARELVHAYDRRGMENPAVADAVAALRNWNGEMQAEQAAPFIATLLYQHLVVAMADRASPGKGLVYDREEISGEWVQMAPVALEKLLRSRPSGWFSDYDQLLLRTFVDAVDEGRRVQGRNIAKWAYGRYLLLSITHPVGSRLPLVGKYFDIGPVEMSGSTTTVKQTTRRIGPSMRMVVDFSDLDRSLMNIVAGESGHILSRHYKDQWPAYYAGRSFPMQFRRIEAKSTLVLVP